MHVVLIAQACHVIFFAQSKTFDCQSGTVSQPMS